MDTYKYTDQERYYTMISLLSQHLKERKTKMSDLDEYIREFFGEPQLEGWCNWILTVSVHPANSKVYAHEVATDTIVSDLFACDQDLYLDLAFFNELKTTESN